MADLDQLLQNIGKDTLKGAAIHELAERLKALEDAQPDPDPGD